MHYRMIVHSDVSFFFFSSRRRHTRFDCDWSSDVCSSDLKIPIIPMSYGNARRFPEPMAAPSVPQSWQGALPFRYHAGPGPARARLHVKTERGARGFHRIWNTIGMIRGERWPDEWVVVGGHRDAWGPGARDNVSGTVCVLETARAFATLAREGLKRARTAGFATWEAEEWGLMGETGWGEG